MINISNYLISHFKGKYRIKCEYDQRTNQFQRKLNDTYEDIDCYIDCYKNTKIFYYGRTVLEAYIPSLGRGRNIVKAITNESVDNIIFDIVETDCEVSFKFKAVNMDKLEKYLKPKTSGANISPFSSKNLPKNNRYTIPDEELISYRDIVKKLGRNRIIELTHMTNIFLKSLSTKDYTWQDIKADMALRCVTGKNYIHSIGEWDDYIAYLRRNID